MKLAIVNDVHVGKDLIKNGVMRAASSKVAGRFPQLLQQIQKHRPDALIDLGDLIRSESADEDLKNYERAIHLFKDVTVPTIHLIGNHEIKQLAIEEITSVWKKHHVEQNTFGVKVIDGIKFVWIDFVFEKNEKGTLAVLPSERLRWLDEELSRDTLPTILLSHYVCNEQNFEGNIYFEKGLEIFAEYSNKAALLDILKKHPQVFAVFSAHIHSLSYSVVNGVHHFTLPAMVDNIAGPESDGNFPEIYTVVDFDKKKIVVKSYSREFCFSTIEVERKKHD